MRLVLLALVISVVGACGDSDRCSTAERLEEAITTIVEDPQQRSLDLRHLTEFEWKRLDAFGEYCPVERVKARTGLEYRGSWWQSVHVPESHTLLVFSNDEAPICYIEVRNAKARGAAWAFADSIFQKQGISAEKATFVINRGGALPVLELKD
jgi:hypothetical protein